MSRALKDATVKRHHYGSHDELRIHLQLFVAAYSHARRIKALHGTPYDRRGRLCGHSPLDVQHTPYSLLAPKAQ